MLKMYNMWDALLKAAHASKNKTEKVMPRSKNTGSVLFYFSTLDSLVPSLASVAQLR